jgi:hypothetical protein
VLLSLRADHAAFTVAVLPILSKCYASARPKTPLAQNLSCLRSLMLVKPSIPQSFLSRKSRAEHRRGHLPKCIPIFSYSQLDICSWHPCFRDLNKDLHPSYHSPYDSSAVPTSCVPITHKIPTVAVHFLNPARRKDTGLHDGVWASVFAVEGNTSFLAATAGRVGCSYLHERDKKEWLKQRTFGYMAK